jgi:type VI secretion system protein
LAAGRSLLARIRRPETGAARRSATDAELRESVLDHLRVMCGTRQGTMLTCPDYGTATVSEMVHAFPDAIAEMARAMKHTITSYEPRLRNVRIVHIPTDDMTLRYEVHAQLCRDSSSVPVQFETSIDASRKVSFR